MWVEDFKKVVCDFPCSFFFLQGLGKYMSRCRCHEVRAVWNTELYVVGSCPGGGSQHLEQNYMHHGVKLHKFWYCWKVKLVVLVTQSCLTLCDPMDCSPPGSSVHGILQARILEWVAIPFSRGSSQPRDGTQVSCIAGRFFTIWATREAHTII